MIQYPYTNCDCYGVLFANRKRSEKASSYTDKDAEDRLLLHKLRPSICHVLQPYVQSAIQRLDYEGSFIYDEVLDEERFQAQLRDLLDQIDSDNIGALWDIHHPYRFAGEAPGQTVQNLGAYIKYTHIKDSVIVDGKVCYKMMGEGDLPIDDIMLALRSINYEGYISLEWLKRYAPDLSDPGIVFPHFANFMSHYMSSPAESRRLYDNHAKTGKYVWPKEHLIDLTFPQVLDRMVDEFPDQYAFRYTTLDYTRTYSCLLYTSGKGRHQTRRKRE